MGNKNCKSIKIRVVTCLFDHLPTLSYTFAVGMQARCSMEKPACFGILERVAYSSVFSYMRMMGDVKKDLCRCQALDL